jgi:hypothetical protein
MNIPTVANTPAAAVPSTPTGLPLSINCRPAN